MAALQRGDPQELEDVPKKPNAALISGILIVVVIAAAVGGQAALSGRAPNGWHRNHTLVIDKKTGARFLVDHGRLRPAPTLTSVLLAGGHAKPVNVPHDDLTSGRHGPPLRGAHYPEQPPTAISPRSGLTACAAGKSTVDVYAQGPSLVASGAAGLLARPAGGKNIYLVAGDRKYRLAGAKALAALNYSSAEVRTVPAAWLALVPAGTRLALLRPGKASGKGVSGLGHEGQVIQARDSGKRFLIQDHKLRPIPNHTSELLAPSPARTVANPVQQGASIGKPYGYSDAPSNPPRVPTATNQTTACVRSSDGKVVVAAAARAGRMRPSAPHAVDAPAKAAASTRTRWFSRPNTGTLLAPPGFHARRRADPHGPRRSTAGAATGSPTSRHCGH